MKIKITTLLGFLFILNGYAQNPTSKYDSIMAASGRADSTVNYFELGKKDGATYYNRKGAFWRGFLIPTPIHLGLVNFSLNSKPLGVATVITAYGSLIGGPIMIFSRVHKTDNPRNPNNALLASNPLYLKGYMKGAHRVKVRKTLGGLGLGLGCSVVAIGLMARFAI